MSDFNWYLNRQGVRGRKGDKGEQGFSPVITEYDTGNPLEYVLRIQTEDGVMYTQNLRPEFVNNGGTYLRFNQSSSVFSIDAADYATTSSQGEVRLANSGDVAALTSTTTAVTPKDVDTILTNKGYATSISNLQSDVSGLDGDLTSLSGTVSNLSGTVNSLSNTVTANYNNTVKLSGNQSINNTKTFAGQINTNNIYNVTGDRTMIRYYASTDSLLLAGATTQNIYLRTSATGKLIHQKDGAEYEVYDESNLPEYTAGRGIDITNGEVSISDEISADPSTGVALLSDGILRVKTGGYQIAASNNRYRNVAKFELTDNNSDGIIFGDLNCVTSIRTSGNAVNILRKDSNNVLQTYTNIDSGNIATYAPVSTITGGTGISASTSGSTITISVDNTVVKTTGYQTISGTKTFTATQEMAGLCCNRIMSYDDMSRVYIECTGDGGSDGGINIGGANDNVRLILTNSTNTVIVRRNGTNYVNIDSGNISDYAGNVSSSSINTMVKLTQAEYDALVQAGTVDASTLYIIV